MRFAISDLRFAICALGLAGLAVAQASAQAQPSAASGIHPIDLPTALRLAGAQNLDVRIAREKLAEARANHESANAQFFPWVSPGIAYRRHDDRIQDVAGNIIDVNKQSYAPGVALAAQWDLGEAIYKELAAKQLVKAADAALKAQRQDAALAAAHGYFELVLAQAAVGVAREAVRISTNYEVQVQNAVEAGIAFKGDLLRVKVQSERNQIALRQAAEQQRITAARLAQTLHLHPASELVARDADLVPLTLVETNAALDPLVQQALVSRPELKQNQALVAATSDVKKGVVYGPLIPSLGAQTFFGGLGGGKNGDTGNFGAQEDYFLGLSWRIGPGGLFDHGRVHSADARLKVARLQLERIQDEISRQVVEAFIRWQSVGDQLDMARRVLAAAGEGLRLASERKAFAVGVVLETILAEQDLTRARLDYLKAIAEFNKAQYTVSRVIGSL